MPRNTREADRHNSLSDEQFQLAMADLVRGIRQDAESGGLRPHHSSFFRAALVTTLMVAVGSLALLGMLLRSVSNKPVPTTAEVQKSMPEKAAPLPILEPAGIFLEPTTDARPTRIREFKRPSTPIGRCIPAGWAIPTEEDFEKLLQVLQRTAHGESVEILAQRLRSSVNNDQRLRSALLMVAPALSGNEVKATVMVLRSLPGEKLESALENSLPTMIEPLRSAWLALLAAGGDQDALRWLMPLVSNGESHDLDVILCVAEILKRHPDRIDEAIAPFLTKPPKMQAAAVETMRKLVDSVSPQLVYGFLESPDTTVKLGALQILSEIPEGAKLPPIIQVLLADPDRSIRMQALKTAARAKNLESIPVILSLPSASDSMETRARYEALKGISGVQLSEDIEGWRKWWQAEGQHLAVGFADVLHRLEHADTEKRAGALRELVAYRHFLKATQIAWIRKQLTEGTIELRRASAYFLLATQAPLTAEERKYCQTLISTDESKLEQD